MSEIDVLPLYKQLSVPLYRYPTKVELAATIEHLLGKLGKLKNIKAEVRQAYRCLISETAITLPKVVPLKVPEGVKAQPPVEPACKLVVIAARGRLPASEFDYAAALSKLGVSRMTPYRSPAGAEKPCFGFYTSNFDQAERVVDELGRMGAIEAAAVVNAIWYARLGRPLNARHLMEYGFVPLVDAPRSLTGVVDGVKVVIFAPRGTVNISGATSPEVARSALASLYKILVASRALEVA